MNAIPILQYSCSTSLGHNLHETFQQIRNGQTGIQLQSNLFNPLDYPVGEIQYQLKNPPETLNQYKSRCCKIAYTALHHMEPEIQWLKANFPPNRLGIVCGTSASGTSAVESAWKPGGDFHFDYHNLHPHGSVARFIQRVTGFRGPFFTVSTACSSAANAMISAALLLQADICDAVITGGVDALCLTTYYGFQSLQIVSDVPCQPFDRNRSGISIGEGAAFFIMTREVIPEITHSKPVYLIGSGTSSDAYHMTAPDPTGFGAECAIRNAIASGGLHPDDIDYINLHGTGTQLNDKVEAEAVHRIFGREVECSSTKGYFGHLLGGAAAIEAAVCIYALKNQYIPGNANLIEMDPEIKINVIPTSIQKAIRYAANNSFAFGGNNTCLIFGTHP